MEFEYSKKTKMYMEQVTDFMGKTDAKNPDKYKQQSMFLVPRDAPGINVPFPPRDVTVRFPPEKNA
jgi:acyl-CoA dehydrogenase